MADPILSKVLEKVAGLILPSLLKALDPTLIQVAAEAAVQSLPQDVVAPGFDDCDGLRDVLVSWGSSEEFSDILQRIKDGQSVCDDEIRACLQPRLGNAGIALSDTGVEGLVASFGRQLEDSLLTGAEGHGMLYRANRDQHQEQNEMLAQILEAVTGDAASSAPSAVENRRSSGSELTVARLDFSLGYVLADGGGVEPVWDVLEAVKIEIQNETGSSITRDLTGTAVATVFGDESVNRLEDTVLLSLDGTPISATRRTDGLIKRGEPQVTWKTRLSLAPGEKAIMHYTARRVVGIDGYEFRRIAVPIGELRVGGQFSHGVYPRLGLLSVSTSQLCADRADSKTTSELRSHDVGVGDWVVLSWNPAALCCGGKGALHS